MRLFKTLPVKLFAAGCITLSITAVGCKSSAKKPEPAVIVQQPKEKVNAIVKDSVSVSALKDTGQQYFSVSITKNNQAYINYEGDFPIGFFDGDYFTLQLPASKRVMQVSHLFVLYFKGIAAGTFPIVASGNEKGKPTLVFTPEKEGNYDIGILADTGYVTITNYSAKSVTGKCEARGKDAEGNTIVVKADFLNVKNNDLAQ